MYSNDPLTESFLIKKYDDQKQKTLDFACAILELELEIKNIKRRIKEVKADAKLDGVAIGLVSKVLNEMKKVRKISDEEKTDLKEFLDIFESEPTIQNKIEELIS